MIISRNVEMSLGQKNYTFLRKKYNLSEEFKTGDKFKINIEDLSKSSHLFVDVTCDYCGIILKVPFKRYNQNTQVVNKYACSKKECSNQKIKDVCLIKYGVENPFQSEFVKKKTKEKLIKKYGVSHPMLIEETKIKIKETCKEKYGFESYTQTEEYKEKSKLASLSKYGVDHPSKTDEFQNKSKKTRIERGLQIPDNLLSDYRKYRLKVNRITNRNKKSILENWDGIDYYDGTYIRDNFNLHQNDRNYPHFDHKISAAYGFKNGINEEIIGDIQNICITKQWINGLKKESCETEFKREFEISNSLLKNI